MMARTQITLDRETQRQARAKAADMGISFAEYIRRLVQRDLKGAEQRADPSLVFDLGGNAPTNVALQKDALIAEAIESERLGKPSQ